MIGDPEVRPQAEVMRASHVLLATCLATFLVSIDGTVLFAAFKALAQAFPGREPASVAWVLNAYTIAVASWLIVSGRLSDGLGHARVFAWGLALFLSASALCGLSPDLPWLVAARVAQGVGAAMLTPSALALIIAHHPASRQAMAIALWGATGGLAAAIGPALGSWVVDAWGWRWAFFLNLPVGLLACGVAWRLLRSGQVVVARSGSPFDLLSAALLAVGLATLSWVLLRHEQLRAADGVTAFAVGLVAMVMFWERSRRIRHALVPVALWQSPGYVAVSVGSLAFSMGFSMLFMGFFFVMTDAWHLGLRQAGLAITPGPLTVIPVTVLSGWLASRFGHRPLIVVGSLMLALGAVWLVHRPQAPDHLGFTLPVLLLTGVGIGLVMSSLTAVATMPLPPSLSAVGAAVNQTIRQIGSVVGVALTSVWLAPGGDHLPQWERHGTVLCLVFVVTAVAGAWRGRMRWAVRLRRSG